MKVNGPFIIEGSANDVAISNVAAATNAGQLGQEKKGTLKFNNGLKLQWDSVTVGPNTTITATFPEAFTAEVYFVVVQLATIPGAANQEDDYAGYLWATTPLSTCRITSQSNATKAVAYLVFGRDSV